MCVCVYIYIYILHVHAKLLQLCPAVCDPVDCRPPGSSVHGIFQARILEWVAKPSSRGSSQPSDRTLVSCIGRQILYHCATWEAPFYLLLSPLSHQLSMAHILTSTGLAAGAASCLWSHCFLALSFPSHPPTRHPARIQYLVCLLGAALLCVSGPLD